MPFLGLAPYIFHPDLARYGSIIGLLSKAESNKTACLDSFFILLFVFGAPPLPAEEVMFTSQVAQHQGAVCVAQRSLLG